MHVGKLTQKIRFLWSRTIFHRVLDQKLIAQLFNRSFFVTLDQGWGDAGTDNLLTVPWKPTTNGYEPSRNFNANTQYADMWNQSSKMQGMCDCCFRTCGQLHLIILLCLCVVELNSWFTLFHYNYQSVLFVYCWTSIQKSPVNKGDLYKELNW